MKTILALMMTVMLTGCGVFVPMARQQSKLTAISIGMTKPEVQKVMGRPELVETSSVELEGRNYEVNEYYLYAKSAPGMQAFVGLIGATLAWWIPYHWMGPDISDMGKAYELYYADGKLVYWNPKGEPVNIPEGVLGLYGRMQVTNEH